MDEAAPRAPLFVYGMNTCQRCPQAVPLIANRDIATAGKPGRYLTPVSS